MMPILEYSCITFSPGEGHITLYLNLAPRVDLQGEKKKKKTASKIICMRQTLIHNYIRCTERLQNNMAAARMISEEQRYNF